MLVNAKGEPFLSLEHLVELLQLVYPRPSRFLQKTPYYLLTWENSERFPLFHNKIYMPFESRPPELATKSAHLTASELSFHGLSPDTTERHHGELSKTEKKHRSKGKDECFASLKLDSHSESCSCGFEKVHNNIKQMHSKESQLTKVKMLSF